MVEISISDLVPERRDEGDGLDVKAVLELVRMLAQLRGGQGQPAQQQVQAGDSVSLAFPVPPNGRAGVPAPSPVVQEQQAQQQQPVVDKRRMAELVYAKFLDALNLGVVLYGEDITLADFVRRVEEDRENIIMQIEKHV